MTQKDKDNRRRFALDETKPNALNSLMKMVQGMTPQEFQLTVQMDRETALREKLFDAVNTQFFNAVKRLPDHAENSILYYKNDLTSLPDYHYSLILWIKAFEDNDPSTQGATLQEFKLNLGLLLGNQLHAYSLIKKIGKVAEAHSLQDIYQKWVRYALYKFCPVGIPRRADTTVTEIMFAADKPIPTSQQLQYILETFTPSDRLDLSDPTHASKEFPLYDHYFSQSLLRVGLIFDLDAKQIPLRGKPKSIQYKAAEHAIRFLQNAQNLVNNVQEIINDPDHPEFADISRVIIDYISNNSIRKSFVFIIAGFNTTSAIKDQYRRCVNFIEKGIQIEFYSMFASELLHLGQTFEMFVTTLAKDDIDDIYSPYPVEQMDVSSIEMALQKTVRANKRVMYKLSDADIQAMRWRGFFPPSDVSITFYNNMVIKMEFIYQDSDSEESTSFSYSLNLQTGVDDWNFLESPTNPQFEQLRTVCKSLVVDIINTVIPQPSQPTKIPPIKTTKRERNVDPVYSLRKETGLSEQPQQLAKELVQSTVSRDTNIKLIDLQFNAKVEKVFRTFSDDEQLQIMQAIEKFNSRESVLVPQFKNIGSTSRLRTGDFRVIVSEEDGAYTVVNIGRRKNMYRKF